jgi:co-chaperonin GroES (HSP10)
MKLTRLKLGIVSLLFIFVLGVYGQNTNIAQGKRAYQSSNYAANAGQPSKAVDGNTSGNWANGSVTHTVGRQGENNPWWEVDLDKNYVITRVEIWNRTDCCQERLSDYNILVKYNVNGNGQPFLNSLHRFRRGESNPQSFSGQKTGRYVRIQKYGKGILSLAEVKVYGYPAGSGQSINVAIGKRAYQSSNYAANAGQPSKAVDGNTSGNWGDGSVTHTVGRQGENNPWWEVDLGDLYEVSAIEVYNRTDCCQERLDNYNILLKRNSNGSGVAFLPGNHQFRRGESNPQKYKGSGIARYVRIQKYGKGILSLAEVKIFGTRVSKTPNPPARPAKRQSELIHIPGTQQKYTYNQLKEELARGGITLVKTSRLKPNQATLVYANASKKDQSAEFGLLMTATKIGDNVTLNSAAVYGGCDANTKTGIGADCEAGVGSQNLTVEFPGGQTDFNVQGPSVNGCGEVSMDKLCANAGATLASTSYSVTDSRGNGVGIGVSTGVGAGLDGGYEDGIISGSIRLRFIAGGSISFSINERDARTKVIKAGKAGYVFAKRKIIGASDEIRRAYKRELPNIRSTTNKAVKIVGNAGQQTVQFFDASFKTVGKEMGKFFVGAGKTIAKGTTKAAKTVAKETKKAAVNVGNWVSVATKGKKPRKLYPGEGYLSVFNQAGYVAKITAVFYLNGKKYKNTENISLGFTKEFYFPKGATNITLTVKPIATTSKLKKKWRKQTFGTANGLKKCFKIWGTIFSPQMGGIGC